MGEKEFEMAVPHCADVVVDNEGMHRILPQCTLVRGYHG